MEFLLERLQLDPLTYFLLYMILNEMRALTKRMSVTEGELDAVLKYLKLRRVEQTP